MGNLFAIRILGSLYDKPATRPSAEPLQPIVPGAWAAWARAHEARSAATNSAGRMTTRVTSLTPAAR